MPALSPELQDPGSLQVDRPPVARSRRPWSWVVGGVAALVVTLAIVATGPMQRLESNVGVELTPLAASSAPPTSMAIERAVGVLDDAEQVAQRLVTMINRGDSVRVAELIAPSLPAEELGSSEWPLIHGDAGWWDGASAGAVRDDARITDFVRYFRTIPGGALVSSCQGRFVDAALPRVVVDCDYSAFGGIRGLMGDGGELDRGVLRVTVERGLVVDTERTGDLTDVAWETLGAWVADARPVVFEAVFGTLDGGLTLRPVYTSAAALRHIDAAAGYARAAGLPSLPIG